MGSFIHALSQVDPIQRFAGRNSFIAKEDAYDPLMRNSANGQAYASRHDVGSTPTPYAGVQPTLAGANAGYAQQAQRVAQQQRPTWQQGQSPFQQGTVY